MYDASWQDESTESTVLGPFAKVTKAGDDLSSRAAVELASVRRIDALNKQERAERAFCVPTDALRSQVTALRAESEDRAALRKELLTLLMTASEEYDTLPEELISRLNKMLRSIDEADERTSHLIATDVKQLPQNIDLSSSDCLQMTDTPPVLPEMAALPIDAKETPIGLGSLREKLGEISITTLLRIRNQSNERLRLKSGMQLKEGKYVTAMSHVNASHDADVCYLYPAADIPPRTELCIASRSAGGWIPTSGINGEIVYTNRDESRHFCIRFRNSLMRHERTCTVRANAASDGGDATWQISKEELDHKANNEIVIVIDRLRGKEAAKAALCRHRSEVTFKSGYLLKSRQGFRMHWEMRWFVLKSEALLYSKDKPDREHKSIRLADIKSVQADSFDGASFEVATGDGVVHHLNAASPEECRDWVHMISKAANIIDFAAGDNARPDENFLAESATENDVELYTHGGAVLAL